MLDIFGYFIKIAAGIGFAQVVFAATKVQLLSILADAFAHWPMP